MRRRVYIYVPGILTFPGAAANWSGRAVTFTHLNASNGDEVSEKVEYFCGPIGRAFGQNGRAAKLARVMAFYTQAGFELVLVGHSNGCAVILSALTDNGWPATAELHLVCGACEADFNRNGLNQALFEDRVGSVIVYRGEKDMALRVAHTWAGKALGYGTLGLHGAVNDSPEFVGRITEIVWPDYGHSDCWHDSNFERTMWHFVA